MNLTPPLGTKTKRRRPASSLFVHQHRGHTLVIALNK
jgi:hypothetical protein